MQLIVSDDLLLKLSFLYTMMTNRKIPLVQKKKMLFVTWELESTISNFLLANQDDEELLDNFNPLKRTKMRQQEFLLQLLGWKKSTGTP